MSSKENSAQPGSGWCSRQPTAGLAWASVSRQWLGLQMCFWNPFLVATQHIFIEKWLPGHVSLEAGTFFLTGFVQ